MPEIVAPSSANPRFHFGSELTATPSLEWSCCQSILEQDLMLACTYDFGLYRLALSMSPDPLTKSDVVTLAISGTPAFDCSSSSGLLHFLCVIVQGAVESIDVSASATVDVNGASVCLPRTPKHTKASKVGDEVMTMWGMRVYRLTSRPKRALAQSP